MKMTRGTKRRHGLAGRPDGFQVGSYIAVLLTNGCVFGAAIPVLPLPAVQAVVGILYILVEAVLVVQACRLTLKDPTEIHTLKTKYYRHKGHKVKLTGEFNHYCKICESVVEGGVHHCKQCQRCVKNLDHHCKWINNCIDAGNIR